MGRFLRMMMVVLPALAGVQIPLLGPWQSLFNGTGTAGWTQAKLRGQSTHPWKVVHGALTNEGDPGMDICTEAEFSDYELELEYRLPASRGNSGVFLRGQIEVQLRARTSKLSDASSGAIFGLHAPRSDPQNSPGEWNRLRVLHLGDEVSVWVNGALVQDRVRVDGHTPATMLESVSTDRAGEPLDLGRGPVMLQGDRSPVWFRSIRIREARPVTSSSHPFPDPRVAGANASAPPARGPRGRT